MKILYRIRRSVILTLFFLGSGILSAQSDTQPMAYDHPKFLGNIYSTQQLPEFENYWNQVTPENAGKWGSVEGTRDQMNWTEMDKAYALAIENGFLFKQHVMIWGSQQPAWMDNLTKEEQLEEIIEWYAAVAERYADIDIVEVVNEPLHAKPKYLEALGGNGETGWDWVIRSFELAREYFPNAKLILNDYGILGSATNIRNYLKIVKLLTDRGLIDHLGVQGHAFTVNDMTAETIKSSLDLLDESGLPIYVTELDIDGPTDNIQLENYQRVFKALWSHESVAGITLWGFRPGLWRQEQKAYLINADGTERPALKWMREYVLKSNPKYAPLAAQIYREAKVYPNPIVNGSFHLAMNSADLLRIVSLDGKIMAMYTEVNTQDFSINIEPGLYLFQIFQSGDLRATEKVLVK